jgi:hypothetical protein
VALVGSYELLMVIIRGARAQAEGGSGRVVPSSDPPQEHAARMFADELAAARVPSIRAIRAQLHVGQPQAQRIRGYFNAINGA